MALRQALRATPRLLRDQPILFVPMAIFGVLQLPQLFTETLEPSLSIVASLLGTVIFAFVTPFFYGGTIGMANDAATGVRTSMGRFLRHAKQFYVSVLLAYLFLFAISLGFGFLIAITAIVGFIVAFGAGGAGAIMAGIVVIGLVLLFLIVLFALHFYAHAIVIEGVGAVDGLSRSVHVVRHNLRSMVGYALVSIVFGGVFGGLFGALIMAVFPPAPEPGEPAPMPDFESILLISGVSVVWTTLFVTVFFVFSVLFYRALIDADAKDTEGADPDTTDTAEPTSRAGTGSDDGFIYSS
ncbi:DUF7847 domain-containing protein [Halorubrum vacuolatum]|uniref:DUF7847 domain-containing protein n=1 Tax=Halorubrum vacuolatum TaxID=63740 RepID=A0A238VY55_HALVU|nr:hypothetical protein [Halorubrum vacuolatum]SNR39101.1 hypothetical protein SAMN06264855_104200 [Halorubrum vacuolatum]